MVYNGDTGASRFNQGRRSEMVTHPNRSRKTISVKLTEDELNWLYSCHMANCDDFAASGEDAHESNPGARGITNKLLKARDELRARQK